MPERMLGVWVERAQERDPRAGRRVGPPPAGEGCEAAREARGKAWAEAARRANVALSAQTRALLRGALVRPDAPGAAPGGGRGAAQGSQSQITRDGLLRAEAAWSPSPPPPPYCCPYPCPYCTLTPSLPSIRDDAASPLRLRGWGGGPPRARARGWSAAGGRPEAAGVAQPGSRGARAWGAALRLRGFGEEGAGEDLGAIAAEGLGAIAAEQEEQDDEYELRERQAELSGLGAHLAGEEERAAWQLEEFGNLSDPRWRALIETHVRSERERADDARAWGLIDKLLDPWGVLYNGTTAERRELATELVEQLSGQSLPEWALLQAMHTVRMRQRQGHGEGPAFGTRAAATGEPRGAPDEAFDPALDEAELRRLILSEKLMIAVEFGDGPETARLLAAGADANFYDREFCDMRPLHRAADRGHAEVLRTLLEAGAVVDARDGGGRTALHVAAQRGTVECTRALLAAGASVEARDEEQRQPVHACAGQGHTACLALLLDAGADVSARSAPRPAPPRPGPRASGSAAACAGWSGRPPVTARAGRGRRNFLGDTPLLAAASWGETGAMELLLDRGADPDAKNAVRCSPLSVARDYAFEDAEALLLERGAKERDAMAEKTELMTEVVQNISDAAASSAPLRAEEEGPEPPERPTAGPEAGHAAERLNASQLRIESQLLEDEYQRLKADPASGFSTTLHLWDHMADTIGPGGRPLVAHLPPQDPAAAGGAGAGGSGGAGGAGAGAAPWAEVLGADAAKVAEVKRMRDEYEKGRRAAARPRKRRPDYAGEDGAADKPSREAGGGQGEGDSSGLRLDPRYSFL